MRTKAAHYPHSIGPAPLSRPMAWCGLLTLCALSSLTGGCGGGDQVRRPTPAADSTAHRGWPAIEAEDPAAANAVLMRAIGLVGTPYRYGGNTPESGFDCSGLVHYVFSDTLDLRLPRTSRELARIQGPQIAPERLAPADLVFFGSGGEVSHVGIYVGEGRFVHAPSTGGTVRLDHLDSAYWRDHYTGAKRVLK
ncbi:MAG: NlpC/P60 family protein [Lysobacteraceae bacterium]|nr:MAG: NlpC/P60 family protein [Xanthomonadaceae bacterium]